MHHLSFRKEQSSDPYPVCILVSNIRGDEIKRHYLDPYDLDPDQVMILDLHQAPGKKKTPKKEMQNWIQQELAPTLKDIGAEYVLCADSEYFKTLTGSQKAEANLGYVVPTQYGDWNVLYVPNYQAVFYDPPKVKAKITQTMTAMRAHAEGGYIKPGSTIIDYEYYPSTLAEISEALEALLGLDVDLNIDIEGFGLKHWEAGIASIAFAWDQHSGISFLVDYAPVSGAVEAPFGQRLRNEPVRDLLKDFFIRFAKTGRKARYHHIAYDAYVLIYQLFMEHLLDTQGLLEGMEILLGNWDCTKLITYLATNSCAGNHLGLKDQAQEFAGNYAMGEDIKDVLKISPDKLLRYNLVDALSTQYVFEKHWDTLIRDQQEDIYETVFKPATLDIIQMQLTGLPVSMDRVKEVKAILAQAQGDAELRMAQSSLVQGYNQVRLERYIETKHQEWKKKRTTQAEVLEEARTKESVRKEITFNPASAPQLQELLYQLCGLPVLMTTDTGLPSTKAEDLKDLKIHTEDPDLLAFLDALLDYSTVAIINQTFIPAFENAQLAPDGWHYLFGSFNLGGTLSGRLSSSDPNLQNLPAGASGEPNKIKYGKLIKSCVVAPPGFIFVGLDFASLEDRISALTTKDPNKLRVYTDGFDGHSLRAYAYYTEQMPDIDPNTVESINSIQSKYKALRAKSKNPTFTLTYQGTWRTLVVKYKFTEDLAKVVEKRYHELYKVSDDWVEAKLAQAAKDGYVTVAFGLRVRTPLLAQVIRGTNKTPYEATAEGRSAGNALGQSWCLLNSRAASEFMGKVRESLYRLDIRPCAQIHDAQYYLVREDLQLLEYLNIHLVEAVSWQNHPDIWHEQVKLGGEVSIFYPSWNTEIVIPNGAKAPEILDIILTHQQKESESSK